MPRISALGKPITEAMGMLKKPEYAGQQPPDYENQCNNKRYMYQPTQSAEKNKTQQPQNKENYPND